MKNIQAIYLLIGVYVLFCLGIFFWQKNFIFFPTKNLRKSPKDLQIEDVYFLSSENIRLHGWFLDLKSDKTVLFFHGNAGNVSDRTAQMQIFHELGLSALIFDYRGYGISEGKIKKEEDLYDDATAALNFLVNEKSIPPDRLIIWGRSLGGAIAIDLAAKKDFPYIVIESTFTSMDEMAKMQFPFLPIKLLTKFNFDSLKKVPHIKSKTLIIHSPTDEMIPFEFGKTLFENLPSQKEFLQIDGSHNSGFIQSKEKYMSKLEEFFLGKI